MVKGQGGSAGGYGAQGTPSEGYNNNTVPTNSSSGMRTGEQDARTGERDYDNRGAQNTTTGSKPSLMDKLNPKIDANGDGKAGFMK